MHMPARKSEVAATFTGAQAQYVLRRLIDDRRISRKDVIHYVGEMQHEIRALEERLRVLREAARPAQAGGAGAPAKRAAAKPEGGATKRRRKARRKRRHQNLSPERLAALKLQGQYLALIRRVPKTRRAQYKKLFAEKGAEVALKALREATAK
jgi:hypothetical protein